jgi:4-hydroxy-tetrahydrodipicolinate synthase
MTAAQWPTGLITALVTPFSNDQLDMKALGVLLERQIEAGVGGVLVCGGTGEFGALTQEERRELAGETARVLAGRLPFFVQTGALATRDVLALSLHAEQIGATGILVASPFGEPLSWRERMHFYEQVATTVDLPIMIYNTQLGGFLSMAQIEQIASLPNVGAIKNSSYDATLLGDLLAWSEETGFHAYVGADSLLALGAANGAHGALLGTGNVIPDELVSVIQLCQRGALSQHLWKQMHAFLRFMEKTSNYVAACKVGVKVCGLDVGDVRAPYLMPPADERDAIAHQLQAVKEALAGTAAAAR